MNTIQYISNESGIQTGVILPIEQWQQIWKKNTSTDNSLDALAEMAKMAQPMGPSDLSCHFEHYTGKRISDEPT